MKRFLFALVFIFSLSPNKIFGTAQVPDVLYTKGDTFYIHSVPLDSSVLNEFLTDAGFIDFPKFIGCGSTACWRGFVAHWKIEKKKLYLIKITTCHKSMCSNYQDADLKEMFQEKFNNNKVKADWFSGKIIAPQGKLVQYIHMGFASIFEKEKHFLIEKGELKKITYFKDIEKINVAQINNMWSQIKDSIPSLFNNNIDKSFNEEDSLLQLSFWDIKVGKKGKIIQIKTSTPLDISKKEKKLRTLRQKKLLAEINIKLRGKKLFLGEINTSFICSIFLFNFYDKDKFDFYLNRGLHYINKGKKINCR